jgi:uncharacterized membrane protein
MKNKTIKLCMNKSIFSLIIIMLITYFNSNAQLYLLGNNYTVQDVSANGAIVVGDNAQEHFMWTISNGLTLIGGVAPNQYGGTTAINGVGTKIAGTRINPDTGLGELSSYDIASQTWTSHGSLGASSGNSSSSSWGISSDGQTIVGLGWINAGSAHAIKWTNPSGVEDLGSTVPGSSSRANAVNYDGSIIAGWQDSSTGFRQGAFWIDGNQTLIFHNNAEPASEVGVISDDGIWMGGGGNYANDYQAYIWSEATGVLDIGPAPINEWRGATTGLSSNGDVVVGYYRPWPAPATLGRGFYYTEEDGLLDLTNYASSLGIDVQGTILALPLAISDDASTVVGLTNAGIGFVLKLPVAPSNNNCDNAISLSCGASISGSTTNATDSGGSDAPDVYYTYTGSAGEGLIEVTLCDGTTNFDTFLRVFSDCSLTNEIASNNDDCGIYSRLDFESDGNSTYYIMVEGAGQESGDYTIELNCLLGNSSETNDTFALYPNPVDDLLYINSEELIKSISLKNMLGQTLYELKVASFDSSIDVSNLNKGTYFLNLKTEFKNSVKKIIKN